MKKIAIFAFLLAVCAAAGRAQESRQDVSISGTVIIEPFRASQTDVQVSSQRAFGALASYRFMLTPSMNFVVNNTNHYKVSNRVQEISAAYVRSFNYRKLNPFVEAGPAAFIFLPVRNSGTTSLDVKQQTEIGGIFGGGVAYEISPSFDIRAEYRGWITKVPTFGDSQFTTNKWYQIYNPVIGVAYHF